MKNRSVVVAISLPVFFIVVDTFQPIHSKSPKAKLVSGFTSFCQDYSSKKLRNMWPFYVTLKQPTTYTHTQQQSKLSFLNE